MVYITLLLAFSLAPYGSDFICDTYKRSSWYRYKSSYYPGEHCSSDLDAESFEILKRVMRLLFMAVPFTLLVMNVGRPLLELGTRL